MASSQLVQTRGIFHGLPVFPDNIKGLTAIITGANGISGQYMLRVLAESPERWTKIYCLSRRPPSIQDGLSGVVEHVSVDFLKAPEDIAKVLRENGVQADYAFFFSYVQVDPEPGTQIWSNAEELVTVNMSLLSNFLQALPLASIKPRRILLQTGAKYYGGQFGPNHSPQEESDPRFQRAPNFYYNQEDYLHAYCSEHDIKWNVVRPSFILGAVPDAAMNLCFPLAVYASVCRHLDQPLQFPYDLASWELNTIQSSAMMNGYLEEWAMLTDSTANEAFNASDDSIFSWSKFWPLFASWYNLESVTPRADDTYQELKMPHDPPPRGYGAPPTIRFKFTLAEWAKRPEVAQAWRDIAVHNGLSVKELSQIDQVFAFADVALSVAWPGGNLSMSKSRKLGWHGFVDSNQSMFQVFHDLEKIKMIPALSIQTQN